MGLLSSMLICLGCFTEFAPSHHRQTYCTLKCRVRARNKRAEVTHKKHRESMKGRATRARRRNTLEGRTKQDQYRQSDAGRAVSKKYQESEAGKESAVRRASRAYHKNPERVKARRAVRTAVGNGSLVKAETCSECGSFSYRIEAHYHKGYEKEFHLDIEWLCRSCHREIDADLT